MPEKEAMWPSSWSLSKDENIVNVERIKLTPEAQRKLGCTIGEHIFLEYPWAYISREAVTKLSEQTGSSLQVFKDDIQKYQPEEFLIGYSSNELTSTDFAICLSETARDQIRIRNRGITQKILEKVANMMLKTPGNWTSLKSHEELDQTFVKITRPFFEIEILLPASELGRKRDLSDRDTDQVKDGYIEILPGRRKYRNVPMKNISRYVQTNLESKDVSVQSYFGYPKNKWTQYDEVVIAEPEETPEPEEKQELSVHESEHVEESGEQVEKVAEEVVEEVPEGPTPLEIFLESHAEEMIDFAKYNAVINMHSDDIDNVARECVVDRKSEVPIGYEELGCFIFLEITKRKFISDVSWHPNKSEYFVISYVNVPRCALIEKFSSKEKFDSCLDFNSGALIWCLNDSLRPKLLLQDVREIHSISFCPYRENVVIGGSANGQIILWDLQGHLEENPNDGEENDEVLTNRLKLHESGVPIVDSIASSDKDNSHILPIRAIRWLPADCRIDSTGKFFKIPDNTSVQFMTASEDGSVAIWDLLCQPHVKSSNKTLKSIVAATMSFSEDLRRLDNVFEPHFRILIKSPKESIEMTLLDLCLPSISVFKADRNQQIDIEEEANPTKLLWICTAQGQMILGTWKCQEFGSEVNTTPICEILDTTTIHDGPILQVSRCPQIEHVLLTIGGHVFAIWKDDSLQVPLLWRRRANCRYTSCCWSNEIPGVFLVGRNDGDLETWDIRRKTKEPVHLKTISGNLITGLYQARGSWNDAKVIGVCDYNGTFRVYRETLHAEDDAEERLQWFRNFVTRETERKREFCQWQNEYLKSNEKALQRRAGRASEESKRRHEEARQNFIREQEELARLKAEKKAKSLPKSKDTLRKIENLEIAKTVLLEKKGFAPDKLEKARLPLVQQENEKKMRFHKAQKEISKRDTYFNDVLSFEFPNSLRGPKSEVLLEKVVDRSTDDIRNEDFRKYSTIREEAIKRLEENPRIPKFDWNSVMEEGRCRKGH